MKKENKNQSMSLIRHLIFVAISLLGFGGIFIVKSVFDNLMKSKLLADGIIPIANDNFYLYYNISIIMCAVLLGLTLLSSATFVLQTGETSKFSRLTVTLAPAVCSAAMLLMSAFYSYLTYDSSMPIASYLIILGTCEAALFLFPLTLSGLVTSVKQKSNKQYSKIK